MKRKVFKSFTCRNLKNEFLRWVVCFAQVSLQISNWIFPVTRFIFMLREGWTASPSSPHENSVSDEIQRPTVWCRHHRVALFGRRFQRNERLSEKPFCTQVKTFEFGHIRAIRQFLDFYFKDMQKPCVFLLPLEAFLLLCVSPYHKIHPQT